MNKITINASRTYEVLIDEGLLSEVGKRSAPIIAGRHAVLVSDSNVMPLYAKTVRDSLNASGFEVAEFSFPAGEDNKNAVVLMDLLNFIAEQRLTRSDAVFALGGGVTGDMAGLAASLYLRGIACVQLPTSLLAMVDSSVGGKTAINLSVGKNQMGTFAQPYLVLCDTTTLSTLPLRVESEGWAEIIKYGMVSSPKLLADLQAPDFKAHLDAIIAHCVTLKRDLVEVDERDTGVRQCLNFGHTIGHAIENCGNYKICHGEAVAIGMAIITRAWVAKGDCDPECLDVLNALLAQFNLPTHTEFSADEILSAMRGDKKRRGEEITLVVPQSLGNCVLHETNFSSLREILAWGL